MAAQDYTAVVQQLYISYFGRPADYFGLQNFSAQLDSIGAPKTFAEVQAAVQADARGTTALSKLVNTFNSSAESAALYGTDNSQIGISKFVAAIYQNVLGREADISGFNFWVNAITSGALTKANAAAAITQGALNNTTDQGKLDALTVQNKLAVATAFTTALDTPTEFNAYAGDAAAATGRSLLQGVSSSTSVTAYQANINDAINTIVNVAVPGSTTALTIGVDTLSGTAGDDVFNAIPQDATGAVKDTLGAFDVIDGGAGKDTLNIYTGLNGGTAYNVTQQGTVKNVETINIYNQTGAVFGGSAVDASKFVGATNINQAGVATAVTKLAAGTTATFTSVSTAGAALSVAAADGAGSVKVGLAGVTGATATAAANPGSPAVTDGNGNVTTPAVPATAATVQNQATLNVSGAALSSVTVSGNLAQANTTAGASAASLALNVAAGATSTGASIGTLLVNTAVKTTLTVSETATGGGHVTSVDASASTGGVTYNAGVNVATVATGTGNDVVTINTVTAAAAGTTAAVNASVSTGAGKDTINVLTSGTGLTTVDAGAGDDTINVTKVAGAGLNIQGGEGNDTVVLSGAALATTDVIDGGAGTDTISLAGSGTRTADDFIVFNKLLKNFETIKFSSAEGATTAFDASLLGTNYTTIDLATGSFVTKVGAQSLIANGALSATASGYKAATADADAVYSGTLNITEKVTGTVTANADVVKLTVAAGTAGNVTGTLAGDAQSAIVTVTNSLNTAGDTDTIAKFVLATNATTADSSLTSVTVSGTGSASITNGVGSSLTTVDASGLGGKYTVGTNAGTTIDGLTYVSNNAAVETIKLGAGVDHVTLNASTYGKADTVTGLNLVLNAGGTALAAGSDTLNVNGATGAVKFTTAQTDFDLALKDAAVYKVEGVDKETVVFSFGGDTYVFHDAGTTGVVDAADVVVKLTGAVNLDALVIALNTPYTAPV